MTAVVSRERFPAPIAVSAMTLMAAAVLNTLRRHLRGKARHRPGPGIA